MLLSPPRPLSLHARACLSARRLCAAAASPSSVCGIDLGTTNSAVAIVVDGRAVIVPDAEGRRTTPSVVSYLASGEVLVGHDAVRHGQAEPQSTFSSAKRFIVRPDRGVAPAGPPPAHTFSGPAVLGRDRACCARAVQR